ncbi:hypothetical protein [Nocardioides marinisabuli]|uniref:hypothetical protein n=1 Tax=Nocardioides marinisabuli TaxID=419476 RepID=UPI0015DF18FF|nr:hypothetical protein [Nocardioides marinisabuli]
MIADLWFGAWSTAVEYEGAQHQEDRAVYVADLDRYHLFRGHGIGYVQVTKERLRHARTLVGTIHRASSWPTATTDPRPTWAPGSRCSGNGSRARWGRVANGPAVGVRASGR